ncbi:MAG: glycosyl hydrolase, partial [Gammaproteobacteria bacterium]
MPSCQSSKSIVFRQIAILIFIIISLQGQVAAAEPVYDPQLYQKLEWRNIGPFRGGRVTAVAGHVDQAFTFYMGATGGGLWKTENGGVTWENISDGYFNTGTIGGIAVAASDPNVIYAGTGESPIRGVTTSHGDGVYKSTDAGKTWQHIGLELTRQIAKVVVHPHDADIVYVAAQGSPWAATDERGIYRSTDGGMSWQRVLFVDRNTGASFLTMDPNNPQVLYASMWDHRRKPWTVISGGPGSGLYKTTDGGNNWVELTNGLPALMGNTAAAVSPANPDRVYAMIEAEEGGVFRSDDAGETWKRVNSDHGIRDRGWYYTHIFADPQDENTVYVLANATVKSTDGGVTFAEIRVPHGDTHDLWINPEHTDWMVHGNDGGANVSYDGGKNWSSNMNQPTAQLYRVITDNLFPYNLYAGQQDNSTVRIPSRTLDGGIGQADWGPVAGGESAQIAFDANNPELIYGSSILGTIAVMNEKTGETRSIEAYPAFSAFRPIRELNLRFNWNAPVVVSAQDPAVIYHGANKVLKSSDRGQSWDVISPDLTRNEVVKQGTTGGPISIEGAGGEHYGTLMYIAESPHDASTIWTGSDDGSVYLTRDGGASWDNVTPKNLPESQINMIEISPHDPAAAYIAVTLYKFNDFTPHIYKTDDYGKHWKQIVDGIAVQAFVRVVREDPGRKGLLYAGTEAGMYVSFNDGRIWQS